MNTTALWIVIAVVVLALIIVGVIVIGNKRKKSKTVSFEKPAEIEEPKALTQQEKSGNYQAKGGFNFAQADAQPKRPEPIRRSAPKPAPRTAEVAQPVQPTESTESIEPTEPAAPTAVPEPPAEPEKPTSAPEPSVKPEPRTARPADAAKPAEHVEQVEQVEPVAGKPAEKTAAAPEREPQQPKQGRAEEGGVDKQSLPEAETTQATEAAAAAAATAEAAGEARAEGAETSDEAIVAEPEPTAPIEEIEPATGRIGKLRGRLSRSQNAIGQGLLGILTAGDLDEDAWEEIEDTLIMADLGTELTMKVTESLREKIAERGVSTEAEARAMLRETLVEAGRPEMDRSIKAMPNDGKPAVILVVGVNGTGKTTTTGKLARVLVSMGHSVVLGAADTFRAAAADQLETWGRRVGATTVRGKEGADPASVAFDAVATGVEQGADVVVIDTAGRLHTSTGLMDQLGKVKRVVEKKSNVDEVLLVLDATVGQNGIMQARVFREVVDITGVVLTKLDGTAKGGIVFQVQEELGVPVKLVGLGEGADDLAPFEVESFVDALLG